MNTKNCRCGRSDCWDPRAYENVQRAGAFAVYCFMAAIVIVAVGAVLYVGGVRL